MKAFFILLILFAIATPSRVLAQDPNLVDMELVQLKSTEEPQKPAVSKARFGFIGRSFISRYNPFSLILSTALFGYQKIMSGQIASNCPYQLSCSNFAKSSLSEFGLLKGTALAVDRVMRCNKLSSADFHPIRINEKGKIEDHPSNYTLKH
jgi:putative component of membrane protein insertase Oxa1/YidC/SpoIIIJ protein YidD